MLGTLAAGSEESPLCSLQLQFSSLASGATGAVSLRFLSWTVAAFFPSHFPASRVARPPHAQVGDWVPGAEPLERLGRVTSLVFRSLHLLLSSLPRGGGAPLGRDRGPSWVSIMSLPQNTQGPT